MIRATYGAWSRKNLGLAEIFGASLLVHLDARSGLSTTVDGASINQADDHSGNKHHATGTGKERLTYAASALGGRGAMRMVSGTSMMTNTGSLLSGDAAHTLIVIGAMTSSGDLAFASVGGSAAPTRGTSTIGAQSGAWWYGGDDSNPLAGTADTSSHLFAKTYAGSAGLASLYVDGSLAGSSTPGAMALTPGYQLAAFVGYPAGSGTADLGEVAIISGVATAAQLADLLTYARGAWGTP